MPTIAHGSSLSVVGRRYIRCSASMKRSRSQRRGPRRRRRKRGRKRRIYRRCWMYQYLFWCRRSSHVLLHKLIWVGSTMRYTLNMVIAFMVLQGLSSSSTNSRGSMITKNRVGGTQLIRIWTTCVPILVSIIICWSSLPVYRWWWYGSCVVGIFCTIPLMVGRWWFLLVVVRWVLALWWWMIIALMMMTSNLVFRLFRIRYLWVRCGKR